MVLVTLKAKVFDGGFSAFVGCSSLIRFSGKKVPPNMVALVEIALRRSGGVWFDLVMR